MLINTTKNEVIPRYARKKSYSFAMATIVKNGYKPCKKAIFRIGKDSTTRFLDRGLI